MRQETFAEGVQDVVVGMQVRRNIQERHRIIGGHWLLLSLDRLPVVRFVADLRVAFRCRASGQVRRRSSRDACACFGRQPRWPLFRSNSRKMVDLFTPAPSAMSVCVRAALRNPEIWYRCSPVSCLWRLICAPFARSFERLRC